jgi:hypothetical protein
MDLSAVGWALERPVKPIAVVAAIGIPLFRMANGLRHKRRKPRPRPVTLLELRSMPNLADGRVSRHHPGSFSPG